MGPLIWPWILHAFFYSHLLSYDITLPHMFKNFICSTCQHLVLLFILVVLILFWWMCSDSPSGFNHIPLMTNDVYIFLCTLILSISFFCIKFSLRSFIHFYLIVLTFLLLSPRSYLYGQNTSLLLSAVFKIFSPVLQLYGSGVHFDE